MAPNILYAVLVMTCSKTGDVACSRNSEHCMQRCTAMFQHAEDAREAATAAGGTLIHDIPSFWFKRAFGSILSSAIGAGMPLPMDQAARAAVGACGRCTIKAIGWTANLRPAESR